MGTSKSAEELVAKLVNAGTHIDAAAKTGVARSALFVKKAVQVELHGVTRLRGVGKKGASIGVRYDIVGGAQAATAIIRMTGPAHLLERDTSAHKIGPTGSHKAIRLANGDFRGSVMHPGTKGKHPFAKGVAASTPAVPTLMMAEQFAALRKVFG